MENLLLYWRFNGVQAGRVLDSSGNNNSGSLSNDSHIGSQSLRTNEPVSDEDEWGERIQLGHALVGSAVCEGLDNPPMMNSATLEAWFRPMNTSDRLLVEMGGLLKLSLTDKGELCIESGRKTLTHAINASPNAWVHVAICLENSKVSLFANGLPGVQIALDAQISSESILPLRIGAPALETTEVRLWTVVRTPDEIRQYMRTPLPRVAPVSKWRGLKINVQPKASPDAVVKPIETSVVKVKAPLKSRRVAEDTPAEPVVLSQQANEINVDLKDTVQANIPATEPVISTPVRTEVSGDKPVGQVIMRPEQSIASPEQVKSGNQNNAPFPPKNVPMIVPDGVSEAMAFFDKLLESAILNKAFLSYDASELNGIIRVVSSFIRSKFRLGPFLCPMPPEDVLSRLQVACSYMALVNVMSSRHKSMWGSLAALRLPLLRDQIKELLFFCVEEAKTRNDAMTVVALTRVVIREFGNSFTSAQIETIKRDLDAFGHASQAASLTCPFCKSPLFDPLQASCTQGCGSRFAVCYVTGGIAAADECAHCRICATTIAVGPIENQRRHRNIPTNSVMEFPKVCSVCGCYGSLVPLG